MEDTKDFAAQDILKIESLSDGKYQVFFSFSEVPVVMNRSYLETVLSPKAAYQML